MLFLLSLHSRVVYRFQLIPPTKEAAAPAPTDGGDKEDDEDA